MASRRDLLKYFSIGTVITPIVGGAIRTENAAEIIKAPEVAPVELFSKVPQSIDAKRICKLMIIATLDDDTIHTIEIPRVHGWGIIDPRRHNIRVSVEKLAPGASPALVRDIAEFGGEGCLR